MNIKKGLKRIHKVIIILSILLGLIFYYQDYDDRKSHLKGQKVVEEILEDKVRNFISNLPNDDSSFADAPDILFRSDTNNGFDVESVNKLIKYKCYQDYIKQLNYCIDLQSDLKKPNTVLIYNYSLIIALIIFVPYILIFIYKFILLPPFNYFKDGFKDD